MDFYKADEKQKLLHNNVNFWETDLESDEATWIRCYQTRVGYKYNLVALEKYKVDYKLLEISFEVVTNDRF